MKSTTILSRLEKLANEKRVNKTTAAYKLIVSACDRECGVIRPCWYAGSGRFRSVSDYSGDVCRLLDQLRVMYETGNDAPRGGKVGTYIKILRFEENKEKIKSQELERERQKKAEEEKRNNYITLCDETYRLCREKNFSIDFSDAKKYAAEPLYKMYGEIMFCNIKKSFFQELAMSFHVLNNDGFKRYVREKALETEEGKGVK